MTDKPSLPDNQDIIQFDYERSLETFRMLADIRFKLLAFVPLISGAAITILATDTGHVSKRVVLMGSVFGLLITLGVTVYNLRNTQIMYVTRFRARELEKRLTLPIDGHFEQNPPKNLRFMWCIPIWADWGLSLIYSTVLAGWVLLIMRTALALFGWEAVAIVDVILALFTLFLLLVLVILFTRLDDLSKCRAENQVLDSTREGTNLAPDRVTSEENKR